MRTFAVVQVASAGWQCCWESGWFSSCPRRRLVGQKVGREDWSAAAARQRELAEMLDAMHGKTDYRVIDAQ